MATLAVWQYELLTALAFCVFVLPLSVRAIDENIEIFLLGVGILAAIVAEVLNGGLFVSALTAPVTITIAVLVFELLFFFYRAKIDRLIRKIALRLPLPLFIFVAIVVTALLSSVITAIVAALLLVEVVHILDLPERKETLLTILGCFAIGLGAALTPFGEPLSVIVTKQLHADFWYLFLLLWPYVIPGIAAIALLAAIMTGGKNVNGLKNPIVRDTLHTAWARIARVYAFVAGLVFLGAGFAPLAIAVVVPLPAFALFWANMVSAVVDNATLAAAEITPAMQPHQITAALLGIIISGGMLMIGNIPNIIDAHDLKIRSLTWARQGVPLGLCFMTVGFVAWCLFPGA